MNGHDSRKRSVYLQREVIDEILEEGERLNCSFSRILQDAWHMSKGKIREFVSANDIEEDGYPHA